MRKYFLMACCTLLIGACGSSGNLHSSRHISLAQACPPGKSFMGCSEKTKTGLKALPQSSAPRGLEYPDVSVWQGAVNWGQVAAWEKSHGWHPFAIWKMGEFVVDRFASRNASQTKALGFHRGGYWFLRNTGCAHEASQIISTAKAEQLQLVELDSEVPEARGYARCLEGPLKRAGLEVGEYTSPGSNPDSSNPGLNVWAAAFGPSHPPCVWTCKVGVKGQQSILGWQFTDGQFGPVVSIPGIGRADVSVSYGIDTVGVPTPKPKPKPKPTPKPKPKPKPTPHPSAWTTEFLQGFQRGFTVHWLRLHHRTVPQLGHPQSWFTPARQVGFNSGYNAAH